MDWTVLHLLNGFLSRHDAVEDSLMLYVRASEGLFVAIVVALFFVRRGVLRRDAVAARAAAAAALAVAKVLALIVARPRPFVLEPARVHLFIGHAADAGFPSDHATAAFAIATSVLLRHRRLGLLLIVLATILAAGRVAAGVHFPSDVIAGASLGTITALCLWIAQPRRVLEGAADLLGLKWDGIRVAALSRRTPGP